MKSYRQSLMASNDHPDEHWTMTYLHRSNLPVPTADSVRISMVVQTLGWSKPDTRMISEEETHPISGQGLCKSSKNSFEEGLLL